MSEVKDDFLREIDELLGDVDDGATSFDIPIPNGSTQNKDMGGVDSELADTINVLSVQDNHSQGVPKTG